MYIYVYVFLPSSVLLSFQKVSVFVSVLTLTAISMERWMAICRPLWFRQTSVRAKRIIVLLWGISFAAAIPDLVVLQTVYHEHYDITICQPSWDLKFEKISLLSILVLFYFIPLLIMTFAYAKVAICLWRSGSANESTGKHLLLYTILFPLPVTKLQGLSIVLSH